MWQLKLDHVVMVQCLLGWMMAFRSVAVNLGLETHFIHVWFLKFSFRSCNLWRASRDWHVFPSSVIVYEMWKKETAHSYYLRFKVAQFASG